MGRTPQLAQARARPASAVSEQRWLHCLIIRYTVGVRTITATEASRRFSDLLDAIEAGESVTVTRGSRPIAEIRPAVRRTGRDLHDALEGIPRPDAGFAADIAEAVGALTLERDDPWVDG